MIRDAMTRRSVPPAPTMGGMSAFEVEGIRIEIDPVTLRERVADPAALSRWCDEHRGDPRAVAYLRMVDRLDDAERAGRESLAEPGLHPVTRAVRRARYAQVLQWQGRFEQADEEFARAAEETGLGEDPMATSSFLALATVLLHRATSRSEHAIVAAAAERPVRAQRLAEAALEDARRALAIREGLDASADQLAAARQVVSRLQAVAQPA